MRNSNKKGFTLVELVVVIAIIGVLAAILVPSMMGYVKKARLKTANGNAKTGYNAVAEWVADRETQGNPYTWTAGTNLIKDASLKSNPGSGTAASTEVTALLYKALSTNGKEAGVATVGGATINGEASFYVQWRKTTSDDIFGQYPDAIQKVDTIKGKTPGTFIS